MCGRWQSAKCTPSIGSVWLSTKLKIQALHLDKALPLYSAFCRTVSANEPNNAYYSIREMVRPIVLIVYYYVAFAKCRLFPSTKYDSLCTCEMGKCILISCGQHRTLTPYRIRHTVHKCAMVVVDFHVGITSANLLHFNIYLYVLEVFDAFHLFHHIYILSVNGKQQHDSNAMK